MWRCFEQFPKVRPTLTPVYQEVYKKHFAENRRGSTMANSLSSRFEGWMHTQIAVDVQGGVTPVETLELGAGGLNHLPYEENEFVYDVVEPFQYLMAASLEKSRLRGVFSDINEIPAGRLYDRIISIAVLEHLTDLPRVVATSGLLLKNGGVFRAGIPNEGHWPWHYAYRVSTGLEFWMRYRLDYEVLMRHEHINQADEIEMVLRFFFTDVKVTFLGITRSLALYRFYVCSTPDKVKCADFLKERVATNA